MTRKELDRIKILSKEMKISFRWVYLYPSTINKFNIKYDSYGYIQKYIDLNCYIAMGFQKEIKIQDKNIIFTFDGKTYSIPYNYIAKIEIQ